MKRCGDCGTDYAPEVLLCPDCIEPLESRAYIHTIVLTTALAIAVVGVLERQGVLSRFDIPLILELEVAFLLVFYPARKVLDRLRDSRRPVLAEMGSVFSPRYDRIMVITLLIAGTLIWLGAVPWARSAELSSNAGFIRARARLDLFVLAGGALAIAAMIYDQGLLFFDLRIANTYAHREDRA